MPQWAVHNGMIDEKWRAAVQGVEMAIGTYYVATMANPQAGRVVQEAIMRNALLAGGAYWAWNEWVGAKKTALS